MKTLVIYSTKHGCTELCAEKLSGQLLGSVDLYSLKSKKVPELTLYDNIIIGGSIYMGKIQKEVSEFCNQNLELLKKKKLGLFICCMGEGETAEKQLETSFPKELLDIAVVKSNFGGMFDFKKMNFMERTIVKKVSKITGDTSNIREDMIKEFANFMDEVVK